MHMDYTLNNTVNIVIIVFLLLLPFLVVLGNWASLRRMMKPEIFMNERVIIPVSYFQIL